MVLGESDRSEKPPENVEIEYVPEEGVFIGHYTGTEHGKSDSDDEISATTVEGESREEVLLKVVRDIQEWKEKGDIKPKNGEFVFYWEE